MKDSFGRKIDYLRISLTDRCNLRCGYCMPKSGIEAVPHSELLSFEEIVRIAAVMAKTGIKKIRLTGGEPLVRKGILQAVKMINDIDGIEETLITTNGLLLAENAEALKTAGIKRVNVSLDTLDSSVFKSLTGVDGLKEVLSGIDAAYSSGLGIKINCVPIRGINDTELDKLALMAKNKKIDVRFIELMPIGCAAAYTGIPSAEVAEFLKKRFIGFAANESQNINEPAKYIHFDGFCGRIGFIGAISHKFCQNCNRVRLTSDGFLKLCLQYPDGTDLKTPLRRGCSDEELKGLILAAIEKKPLGHNFTNIEQTDSRKMVQIGG